jgi:hypothetical protein
MDNAITDDGEEVERMLKALIKSLENKPLKTLLQLNWRRVFFMKKSG